MKMIKTSLIAALAISGAMADGATTLSGKITGYYYTGDTASDDMLAKEASQLATATTLDVSHKINDNITLNFSAVGYLNTIKKPNKEYMDGKKDGAYFNVANATFTYDKTTFIAGRQLVDTPMVGGFDWLLAPGAFEAYTLVNNSVENVTFVGSYLRKWRGNDSGDTWTDLTDIDDGNNWTVAAAYNQDKINASLWYYNVDAGGAKNPDKYTQVYVDGGYDFGVAKAKAQFVMTDYDTAKDSNAYAVEVSGKVQNFDLTAAVANVSDNAAGFVGRDSLYTSSWNTFASAQAVAGDDTLSWKVGAATTISNIDTTLSYAQYGDEGSELDLILGYKFADNIDAGFVYTLTDSDIDTDTDDAANAIEIYANYTF